MSAACKLFVRTSLSCLECSSLKPTKIIPSSISSLSIQNLLPSSSPQNSRNRGFKLKPFTVPSREYGSILRAVSLSPTDDICADETNPGENSILEPAAAAAAAEEEQEQEQEEEGKDTVEGLLLRKDDVSRFMKMERRTEIGSVGQFAQLPNRWFPYLDQFKTGTGFLRSDEVLEALDPYIMEVRKERFRNVVKNRSYSVCLVVEGLCDFGNVSAVFRSADALGFQSVHVVSTDSSKRYRDNRHVSMGAEKWLDIELWDSVQECFEVLKSRGYCIATTHVGMEAVSIYDMDWSCPTAIVVGNENRGITDEALELSDLHCSIPMKGMVDSFNVSVAAGILMHHAVCDRSSRMGCHGDLTSKESQILLAEFSLRHRKSAISIAHEYAKRKIVMPVSKL